MNTTFEFGLRRATNVHWQALDVNAQARASLKGQEPCVLWFTGLSGSGKSTLVHDVIFRSLEAMHKARESGGDVPTGARTNT